eukprot:1178835-Prorocentrum_minimum.AAC.3
MEDCINLRAAYTHVLTNSPAIDALPPAPTNIPPLGPRRRFRLFCSARDAPSPPPRAAPSACSSRPFVLPNQQLSGARELRLGSSENRQALLGEWGVGTRPIGGLQLIVWTIVVCLSRPKVLVVMLGTHLALHTFHFLMQFQRLCLLGVLLRRFQKAVEGLRINNLSLASSQGPPSD